MTGEYRVPYIETLRHEMIVKFAAAQAAMGEPQPGAPLTAEDAAPDRSGDKAKK